MPSLAGPHQNIAIRFDTEKLVWCHYLKNFEAMFIHFDRIHERDGRMDGQTDTMQHTYA